MTSHLDDGTIHELLDGEIPSTQLPPLQAHLASCAACRARVASARELVDVTDELVELLDDPPAAVPAATVVTPLPTPARAWMRQLAWAASIAVAVGAGWYVRGDVQQVLPAPTVTPPPTADPIIAAAPIATTAPEAIAHTSRPRAPVADAPAAKPVMLGTTEQRATIDDLTRRARAESAQEPAPPPAVAAATLAKATEGLRAGAASGGGIAVSRAPAAAFERGNRSDLGARDQVVTKQLLSDTASADTVSIQIVALEWLLDSSGIASTAQLSARCVGVSNSTAIGDRPATPSDEHDLPDALRARLTARQGTLRPRSACSEAAAPLPMIETATGLPAVHILIGRPRLPAADRAVVGMQHHQDGRSATGYRCELERRNGAWVVVRCRVTWVA